MELGETRIAPMGDVDDLRKSTNATTQATTRPEGGANAGALGLAEATTEGSSGDSRNEADE